MFEYSKEHVESGGKLHELNSTCSQIIELLGRLACDSPENKLKLREVGLVDSLYNHPFIYIMDIKLK